jgi:hypothetical protein
MARKMGRRRERMILLAASFFKDAVRVGWRGLEKFRVGI